MSSREGRRKRLWIWPTILATVGLAGWGVMRQPPEVALPSFARAERMVDVTPTFRLPKGTVPATRYVWVSLSGPWEETVARLDRDLTAQGFRRGAGGHRYVAWSRGDHGATAVSYWTKEKGKHLARFSLTRPANLIERTGRWWRDRTRR